MPSYSQLESQARSAKSNTNDDDLRKLADTVAELAKKVKHLEAEVQGLRSLIR